MLNLGDLTEQHKAAMTILLSVRPGKSRSLVTGSKRFVPLQARHRHRRWWRARAACSGGRPHTRECGRPHTRGCRWLHTRGCGWPHTRGCGSSCCRCPVLCTCLPYSTSSWRWCRTTFAPDFNNWRFSDGTGHRQKPLVIFERLFISRKFQAN